MFRTGATEAERLIPLGFAVSAAERSLTEAAGELTVSRIFAVVKARWRD